MYHPSFLKPLTILKIQTAQRSVTLPLVDHLHICLSNAVTLRERGEEVSNLGMMERADLLAAEYEEQIRILTNITHEAREAYEEMEVLGES